MRLYSTPQSAEEGEITFLAIIETISAVSFSVWVGIHFETVNHILIGGCLAPFFLLRTKKSTDIALQWGKNYCSFLMRITYAQRGHHNKGNQEGDFALRWNNKRFENIRIFIQSTQPTELIARAFASWWVILFSAFGLLVIRFVAIILHFPTKP